MYGSELDADHPVSVTYNCTVDNLFTLFASQIKILLTAGFECFSEHNWYLVLFTVFSELISFSVAGHERRKFSIELFLEQLCPFFFSLFSFIYFLFSWLLEVFRQTEFRSM